MRSPLKYENGRLVPVIDNSRSPVTMPATAHKAISSFNVVEGSPARKSNHSVALGELNRPKNITESNFFKVDNQENELGEQNARSER